MADAQQFSIWVTQLGGRVKYLQESLKYKTMQEIEKEANTCRSELSRLYDYVRQYNVDIDPYYFQFQDIYSRLRIIKDYVRGGRFSGSKQPLWLRILGFVTKAINFVSSLFGLGPLLPRLPELNVPKKLPFDES